MASPGYWFVPVALRVAVLALAVASLPYVAVATWFGTISGILVGCLVWVTAVVALVRSEQFEQGGWFVRRR